MARLRVRKPVGATSQVATAVVRFHPPPQVPIPGEPMAPDPQDGRHRPVPAGDNEVSRTGTGLYYMR